MILSLKATPFSKFYNLRIQISFEITFSQNFIIKRLFFKISIIFSFVKLLILYQLQTSIYIPCPKSYSFFFFFNNSLWVLNCFCANLIWVIVVHLQIKSNWLEKKKKFIMKYKSKDIFPSMHYFTICISQTVPPISYVGVYFCMPRYYTVCLDEVLVSNKINLYKAW